MTYLSASDYDFSFLTAKSIEVTYLTANITVNVTAHIWIDLSNQEVFSILRWEDIQLNLIARLLLATSVCLVTWSASGKSGAIAASITEAEDLMQS